MTDRFEVVRERKHPRNRAHLKEAGASSTFCGLQTNNQGWKFIPDHDATAEEFITEVTHRCEACLRNARVIVALNGMVEEVAND